MKKIKVILSFSFICIALILLGIISIFVANIVKIQEENYIDHINIDEVITAYALNDSETIKSNTSSFLLYYNAVMKNESLDKKAQTFYLNFFNYINDFKEYIDINIIINNVSRFKLLNPEDIDEETKLKAINESIAAKTIYDGNLRIEIYSYHDEDDYYRILTHETFHLFSNFGSWSLISNIYIRDDVFYAYDYLNPPLNISSNQLYTNIGWIFLEATTEVFTNEYNSHPNYEVYKNEVLALKILLEIIDSKTIITAFNKKNGVVDILNEINSINNTPYDLLEIVQMIDEKILNINNNIIEYYKYYEYLITLAQIKYATNLENLPIELAAYIDQFKLKLLNSNLKDKIDDLKNETQNTDFYQYLLSDKYLLNNYFTELNFNKLESIIIQKRYFKSNQENEYIKIIYEDIKTAQRKESQHELTKKDHNTGRPL